MTKVLLVEDDAWLAELEAGVLKDAGYEVDLAGDAQLAVAAIDKGIPDVVVLDVLLPGRTGFTLLHELQSYSDTGILPIILCTNTAGGLKQEDLKNYGVRRVIDKSTMHPDDLVAAVRSVL